MDLIQYLRNEIQSCTTHGLPYIVNADLHWFERLYWIFNFAICFGVMFVLLTAQYTRLINTPVVTSVEIDYFNWNVSYPAITLCPLQKLDVDFLGTIVNETKIKTGLNLESYYYSLSTASLETVDRLAILSPDVVKLINPEDYSDIAALLFGTFDNRSMTTNTNWPVSVQPVITEAGMCHIINSNVADIHDPNKWKDGVSERGRNNIQLSVHDDFFTQIMNYADVYKVFIHSTNEIILSTSASYTYDVEGFLYLGLQIWSTRISDDLRYSSIAFRKCRFIDEPISKRYPVYTYNHCMLECRIRMIIALCGCLPHFYKPLENEKICNLNELACVGQYKREIIALSTSNNTLKKFNSTADLPRSSLDCGCLNDCETDVYSKDIENFLPQQSLSRLRIGISSFPKVRVVRDIIFSVYDMVLKTGGVINLCIGSSVISLLELLMMALRIPIGRLTTRIVMKIKNKF